eukprot:2232-Heterococcus_DN1.PRE.2
MLKALTSFAVLTSTSPCTSSRAITAAVLPCVAAWCTAHRPSGPHGLLTSAPPARRALRIVRSGEASTHTARAV